MGGGRSTSVESTEYEGVSSAVSTCARVPSSHDSRALSARRCFTVLSWSVVRFRASAERVNDNANSAARRLVTCMSGVYRGVCDAGNAEHCLRAGC